MASPENASSATGTASQQRSAAATRRRWCRLQCASRLLSYNSAHRPPSSQPACHGTWGDGGGRAPCHQLVRMPPLPPADHSRTAPRPGAAQSPLCAFPQHTRLAHCFLLLIPFPAALTHRQAGGREEVQRATGSGHAWRPAQWALLAYHRTWAPLPRSNCRLWSPLKRLQLSLRANAPATDLNTDLEICEAVGRRRGGCPFACSPPLPPQD